MGKNIPTRLDVPPLLAGIPRQRWPKHVAIIMDGNGRWARQHGLPRIAGHREGAKAVRRVVEEASRLGLERLTLYAFSHENWQRPKNEVSALMALYEEYLKRERKTGKEKNIRFINIGRRAGLSPSVVREIEEAERLGAGNTGLALVLAVNYGGRQEIVDAARELAAEAKAGTIDPAAIDEKMFASKLYRGGAADVDLLIRTAGEMRISNFLLWQVSYAELYVTDVLWPDFKQEELHRALAEFARRERRFGGLAEPEED